MWVQAPHSPAWVLKRTGWVGPFMMSRHVVENEREKQNSPCAVERGGMEEVKAAV